MSQSSSAVLKNSKVKVGEPRPLAAAPSPAGHRPRQGARIVSQDADGATIEVTCGCGRTLLLKVDYGPGPTPVAEE